MCANRHGTEGRPNIRKGTMPLTVTFETSSSFMVNYLYMRQFPLGKILQLKCNYVHKVFSIETMQTSRVNSGVFTLEKLHIAVPQLHFHSIPNINHQNRWYHH